MPRKPINPSSLERSRSASSPATTLTESSAATDALLPPETPPANGSPAEPVNNQSELADDSEMPLETNNIPATLPEVIAAIELAELLNAIAGYSLAQRPWDDVRTAADALKLLIGQHTSS